MNKKILTVAITYFFCLLLITSFAVADETKYAAMPEWVDKKLDERELKKAEQEAKKIERKAAKEAKKAERKKELEKAKLSVAKEAKKAERKAAKEAKKAKRKAEREAKRAAKKIN
jgi:colicin import membrane protein